ncbi:MAG: hypothetical protein OHK0039_36150 [Bacteroidia bacterium]
MLKNEFPFDSWLTRMANQDSIQNLHAHVDSLMRRPSRAADTAALSQEWRLAYLLSYGWYEIGLDKTHINRYYRADTNKFRPRGADLLQIFRPTERWSARLIGEHTLIIQYGYAYPNGNQTSWAYHHVYMFTP